MPLGAGLESLGPHLLPVCSPCVVAVVHYVSPELPAPAIMPSLHHHGLHSLQ